MIEYVENGCKCTLFSVRMKINGSKLSVFVSKGEKMKANLTPNYYFNVK